MEHQKVVAVVEDGVRIVSDKGVCTVSWSELMQGHSLIENGQSFQLGVYVGKHIAQMEAANDE